MDFARVQAFDDGFFPPAYKGLKGKTVLVGIEVLGFSVLKISWKCVAIDGRECSRTIVEQSKAMGRPDLILLDGITYAGFDVVDPEEVHAHASAPVITVQQYRLNLDRVRKALFDNFADADERFRVIERVAGKFQYLDTPWKTIQYCAVGISQERAREYLARAMVYSPVPEPLRVAHAIASSLSRKLYQRGFI